ncbi:MAG: neutral/alkaline non-lysosomal ceramidase N-terminal domain-containing protein [Bacteroidota bacterium]
MKKIRSFVVCIFVLFSTITMSDGQDRPDEITPLYMGAAKVDITPGTPVPMSGYSAREMPFSGIHDQLFATALYFRSSENSLLLITADLIGYSRQFIDQTREMISARIGISAENILLTAAHNHGGPVTKTYEKDVPETVDNYVKELQEQFINLSVEASEKAVPVRMGTGKGHCEMNINRRAEFADGGIWLGRASDKPCDHELDIVRFDDFNNRTLAVLINWPCHATTSGQDNLQITGDWPGAAARYFNSQAGEEVVVAVTAGASGDINPIYGPGNDFKEIEAVGYHVGKAAWETYNKISTFQVGSVDAINSSLILPGKKAGKDHFPQKIYESGPDVEIRLSTFRIGHLVLAGISGEVMNEIGTEIKKQSPYTNTVIITHCNGSSGYICTDEAFSEGGYEVKVTRLMPGAEKPLISQVLQSINSF